MSIENQIAKIRTILSKEELDGYTAQAKKRGITAEEFKALEEKRQQLEKRR